MQYVEAIFQWLDTPGAQGLVMVLAIAVFVFLPYFALSSGDRKQRQSKSSEDNKGGDK